MSASDFATKSSVKMVGANGQISLGKEYAGRQVLVEEREPGVWYVRTAIVIPENEQWLHTPKMANDLQEALEWASKHPAAESDLEKMRAVPDAQDASRDQT